MPLPDDVKTVRPRLMREEVYRALRHWIVDGTLQPGEKVRDVDLGARLAVSRMPVREALRIICVSYNLDIVATGHYLYVASQDKVKQKMITFKLVKLVNLNIEEAKVLA